MKLKLLILFSLCWYSSLLISATITVNQDGTADYTQINQAVAESTDGDTIKVYPGIYEGNILLEDRHDIFIASLYHWTEIDSFKYNTILNGILEYPGIIIDLSSNITIQGFTIRNCIGSYPHWAGAGLKIQRSDPIYIFDNHITDNHASWGAGIYITGNFPDNPNYVVLRNNSIIKNYAGAGAGLFFCDYSQIIMEEGSHNSVHSNLAGIGADLYWKCDLPATIYIDTLSIAQNDDNFNPYYFYDREPTCELLVSNHKFDLVDSDLYVDADLGNNDNSGTINSPMKTISYALSRIKSNQNITNSVFINSGTYNQESCGLPLKNNLSIIGDIESPIIDYNDRFFSTILFSSDNTPHILNLTFENLSFYNITKPQISSIVFLGNFHNIKLNNINFYNTNLSHSLFFFWQDFYNDAKLDFQNNNINNLTNGFILGCVGADANIINCMFKNTEYTYWGEGLGKSVISFSGYDYNPINPIINIINTEVTNNEAANNWPGETGASCGVSTGIRTNVNIVNSTIANNRGVPSYYHPSGEYGRAIQFWEQDSHVNIVNSIIYGNDEYDLGYKDPGFYEQNNNYSLNVVNSIVGTHEMDLHDSQISFDNVWNDDPGFAGEEAEYPFALLETSYAIDAGVMNYLDHLPDGFEFPETDLAGNPRISGNAIDLGAYEYQDSVSAQEYEVYTPVSEAQITSYPNPARPGNRSGIMTKINLNLAEDGDYKLEIYNIKGQKVRSILDAFLARGKHSYNWNGKDSNGRNVASGTYLVKCELDGKPVTTSKITLVK